jgi:hypothetical protein
VLGKVEGPGILAAQDIQGALADIDQSAASTLLAADPDVSTQLFELRRMQAMRRIIDASATMTDRLETKSSLLLVLDGLSRYLAAFAGARTRKDMRDGAWTGAYRAATDLMHRRVLAEAQALDRTATDEMMVAYRNQKTITSTSEGLAVVCGGALVVVLLWAQVFLARRMRRTLNLPLLGATALAFVMLFVLVGRFNTARADMKIAKEDAFDSMQVVARIRATSRDAHGDVKRAQLDRAMASKHNEAFARKVAVLRTGDRGVASLFGDATAKAGLLGEPEAVDAMKAAFTQYYTAVQVLQRERDATAQVRLSAEADAAFEDFDATALRVFNVNKDMFDAILEDADRGLRQAEILDPICAILIALLGWLGMRPRLREYA